MPVSLSAFAAQLRELGVTAHTLSLAQREALDRQGYFVAEKVIDTPWRKGLREAFESLYQANREAGARKKGTRHVEGWLEAAPELMRPLVTHPLLLAAAWHVIGRPFGLGQLHGREPLPGFGGQGLHADWGYDGQPGQYHVVNSLWLLDDFTAENGATRIVPGSQLLPPQRRQPGAEEKHPQQQLVLAPAGSVLIFNGHLWHGGTRNASGAARRAIQCGFVAAEFSHLLKPLERQPQALQALRTG